MRFNFRGVYISRICNFRVFRVFKFVVAGYSGVEIFANIRSESVYHNSIWQLQKGCVTCLTRCWICLKMPSYRMESCIQGFYIYKEVWTALIGERIGCARERSTREDPFAVAMKRDIKTVGHIRARSRSSVRCSCSSVGSYPVKLREQQIERRLIAILVTHDVIDWFELCTCQFTVTFKYSRMKYSRMAADPRKPRTLNPAKIKAHTVV